MQRFPSLPLFFFFGRSATVFAGLLFVGFAAVTTAQIPQLLPADDDEAAAEVEAEEKEEEEARKIRLLGVEVTEKEIREGYQIARGNYVYRSGMKKPVTQSDYIGSYKHYKPQAVAPDAGGYPDTGVGGVGGVGRLDRLGGSLGGARGTGSGYNNGGRGGAGASVGSTARRGRSVPQTPHPSGIVVREKNEPEFRYVEAKFVKAGKNKVILVDFGDDDLAFVETRRDYKVEEGDFLPLLLKKDEHRRRGPYKAEDDPEPFHLELWQDYTITLQEYVRGIQADFILASGVTDLYNKQVEMRRQKEEREQRALAARRAAEMSAQNRSRAPVAPSVGAATPGTVKSGFRSGVQRQGGLGSGSRLGGGNQVPGERRGFGSGSSFRKGGLK